MIIIGILEVMVFIILIIYQKHNRRYNRIVKSIFGLQYDMIVVWPVSIISLCKKTPNTALFSFLKQSFTISKLLGFKNIESLVFEAFLSKTEKSVVFLQPLIRQTGVRFVWVSFI